MINIDELRRWLDERSWGAKKAIGPFHTKEQSEWYNGLSTAYIDVARKIEEMLGEGK